MSGFLKFSEGINLGIHAMSYLVAVPEGATATQIASDLKVSRDHLGKVLQRLAKVGLLDSRRGPRGGFNLTRDPKEVTLLEVVEAIDGPISTSRCLMGSPICGTSCVFTELVSSVHKQIYDVLSSTTLVDLPPASLGPELSSVTAQSKAT